MAWRNLLNIKRNPQLLVFATIQPVIFVVMFRYVFGGAIQGSLPAGQTYVNFLMPGIFVQTIVFGALTTGVGLADDLSKGLIDRFRSLPMARSAVLVGRTLADFVRNFFVVILMCVVGFIVGWTIGTDVFGLLGAIAIILAFSYSLSWVFAIVGLTVKDAETAQAVSFPILAPLVFASSAFVPVATMPSWLQGWAKNQPVSVVVNAAALAHHRCRTDERVRASRRSSGSSASSRCARRSPSPATAAPSDSTASRSRRYAPGRSGHAPLRAGIPGSRPFRSRPVRSAAMGRDIATLVASMTLDEKAAFTAGADFWTLVAQRAGRDPTHPRDRRTERGSGERAVRARRRDRGVCAVRVRARRHVGSRAGRAGRGDAGRRGAHQGLSRVAGADGQPPPLTARGPELRVLLGGSAALGEDRGRLRARCAVAGGGHHGEALRR